MNFPIQSETATSAAEWERGIVVSVVVVSVAVVSVVVVSVVVVSVVVVSVAASVFIFYLCRKAI